MESCLRYMLVSSQNIALASFHHHHPTFYHQHHYHSTDDYIANSINVSHEIVVDSNGDNGRRDDGSIGDSDILYRRW